jgi:hypothetical protein
MDGHSVDIRQVPGKGLGVITTRDFWHGTRVMADQPLIRLPSDKYTEDDLQKVLSKLSVEQRSQFDSPHVIRRDRYSRDKSVLDTNVFEIDGQVHVYPKTSRINH